MLRQIAQALMVSPIFDRAAVITRPAIMGECAGELMAPGFCSITIGTPDQNLSGRRSGDESSWTT